MRVACTALVVLVLGFSGAHAQNPVRISAGVSGGATYYCIVSRCDTGSTVGVFADVEIAPILAFEIAGRRQFCFDCDRFIIGDAGLVLRYPARRIRPFISAGVSRTSDPEFMGTHTGLSGATGAWGWFNERWGTRIELRGRQVGRGDAIGELSLSLAHRFGGT